VAFFLGDDDEVSFLSPMIFAGVFSGSFSVSVSL